MCDGWVLVLNKQRHDHTSSNWKIFTLRLFSKSNNIVYLSGIWITPTFSIALLCWDHRSEKVRNYPTIFVIPFNHIFLWRNADCGWSISADQLIYRVNAWANVWSQICSSFGEKLCFCSFTSTVWVILFTSKTVKIDTFESSDAIIFMSWWCFDVLFTFLLMSSYFANRLNPSRIQFPFTSSSGLIILHWRGPWRGQSKSAQTLPFMSALVSMSHWVSQAMSRRLDGPFPPFLMLLSWAAAPCAPPPPFKLQKRYIDSSKPGL